MIDGIGIDSVEINRFADWHTYNQYQLRRIFSEQEIIYCQQTLRLSAERFAVRFAAKEAFFKAWNSALPEKYAPFLTFCKAVSLKHGPHNSPNLAIHWDLLPSIGQTIIPLVSLTHTRTIATACVFLKIIST